MVMVSMVGSGGDRNGNDRSGTTTTFPLLSLSRLQGSLCPEAASFQLAFHIYAEYAWKRINLEANL